jgi:hypothetical protein
MPHASPHRSTFVLASAVAFVLLAGCDANRGEAAASTPAAAPDATAAVATASQAPSLAPVQPGAADTTCPPPASTEPYSPAVHGERVVGDAQGLGPVRLGMTIDEARTAMPDASFVRSPDADGVAFVGVRRGEHEVMSLYADEDDPEAPIDGSRRIGFIQSFSPAASVGGLAVGDMLEKAEALFGPVRGIVESEIEMRQYVEFERQPAWLGIRIDYSGDFAPGERRTTRYCPGARIMALHIRPPAPAD